MRQMKPINFCLNILKTISAFFKADKIEYCHRDRSIETIAVENGLDIDKIKEETLSIIKQEGRVETITKLRHRFPAPLSPAWYFVN